MLMHEGKLLLPAGDTHTAPIQAMERVLSELPLDGCEIRRSQLTRGLEYVAPPGKAFRISGPGMRVSRIKDYMIGSRHEADGPIPKDPLAVDESERFESGVIPEHVATVLAVEARAPGFVCGHAINNDGWTEHPVTATSDDVSVEISLRDQPQAWSYIGYAGIAFAQHNGPYSKGTPVLFDDAENRYIGYRQATITGDAGEVTVELVDIDYEAMKIDGKVYSPDGRELQIAGSPLPNDGSIELPFNKATAEAYDDFMMEKFETGYRLGELPREQRLQILWNGRRDIIVGDNFQRRSLGPFSDDPLRDFDLVYVDADTGKVADMDRLIEVVKESARLSMLSYNEATKLTEDEDENPNPDVYRRHGRKILEPIPHQGSLSVTIANYCSNDWEFAAGQRGADPTLFGWYVFPSQLWDVRSFVAKHSINEVVEKYASYDWRIQEKKERRLTSKPRDVDIYLGVISSRSG